MNRFAAVVSSALLCSAVSLSQESVSTTSAAGQTHTMTMHFGPRFHEARGVTGAPYSAEEVDETDQTLSDGTHIHRQMPTLKVYRDSMGRTRTERRPFFPPEARNSGRPDWPAVIEINDPVDHCRYVLDAENKIAYRQQPASHEDHSVDSDSIAVRSRIEAGADTDSTAAVTSASGSGGNMMSARTRAGASSAAPVAGDTSRPQSTSEDLGTETIDGVLAKGRRSTTTYPVGFMGNDRPFTTTHEFWRSPELKVMILSKSDDPRSGLHTHKLTNISTSEPDPALFQPPSGYTATDEEGDFTISWSSQQR